MILQAEVDAGFAALSQQYRRLAQELIAKTGIQGQPLALGNTADAQASGLNPNRIYRIDSGTLTAIYDNRRLYLLEEGALILPDAGLQTSGTHTPLNHAAENAELTGFDTLPFMQAVLGERETARLWTKLLLTWQAMLLRALATRTERDTHARPGFQHFAPGDIIMRQGDRADYVFSLLEGEAEVLSNNIAVGRIGEGEIIGAMAVLTGQPRSATVRAKTRCTVVKVPHNQFTTLIRDNPTMIHTLLTDMARHIVQLNKQVVDLSVDPDMAGHIPDRTDQHRP